MTYKESMDFLYIYVNIEITYSKSEWIYIRERSCALTGS